MVSKIGFRCGWPGPDATGEAPSTSWTSLCRTRTAVVVSAAISSRAAHGRDAGAILASRWCPHWRKSLLIVTPGTVLEWHRKGWKAYWRWRSRRKKTIGTKISACATPDVILVGFGSKADVGEARFITNQAVLYGRTPLVAIRRFQPLHCIAAPQPGLEALHVDWRDGADPARPAAVAEGGVVGGAHAATGC